MCGNVRVGEGLRLLDMDLSSFSGLPIAGRRYLRQIRLPELGVAGQQRIENARVLVLGAGGLGSPVLQYLAAAGVGTIGIVDDDRVEETNLHRQVIHGTSTLGEMKVSSAISRLQDLVEDEVKFVPHPVRLSEANAKTIFADYDVIVDGTDNFPTRYLASDVAAELNKPVVWGSVLGFAAQVSVFWAEPPRPFSTGTGVTLRDVFPEPPPEGSVPTCAEAGVLGPLPGMVGSVMALEALKLVAQMGEVLFGRILVIDSLRATTETIPLRPGGKEARLAYPRPEQRSWRTITRAEVDPDRYLLVDVREADEYAEGHIPGAYLLPLSEITAATVAGHVDRLVAEAAGREYLLYCRRGVRARHAARLLAEVGAENLAMLTGDYPGWLESGSPVVYGPDAGALTL